MTAIDMVGEGGHICTAAASAVTTFRDRDICRESNFNLLLRFDSLGKTILTREELRYNHVLIALALALVTFIVYCQVTGYSLLEENRSHHTRAEHHASLEN